MKVPALHEKCLILYAATVADTSIETGGVGGKHRAQTAENENVFFVRKHRYREGVHEHVGLSFLFEEVYTASVLKGPMR